jgi:phage gp45-like
MDNIFSTLISNLKSKINGIETNIVKVEGFDEDIFEAEPYQHFGFLSKAIKGTKFISAFLSNNKRNIITIASKNYNVTIEINDGETCIYSTDSNGSVKASIILKADGTINMTGNANLSLTSDGKISLNGNSEAVVLGNTLLTKLNETITVLKTHNHPNGNQGAPTGAMIQTINSLDDTILSKKNFGV